MGLITLLHAAVHRHHGGGIQMGGLQHVQSFNVGFLFMGAAIVQGSHGACALDRPGQPSRQVSRDGGEQERTGGLFEDALGGMALIDMLKLVCQYPGELFGAVGLFQETTQQDHLSARGGKRIYGRVVDDGQGNPVGRCRTRGCQRLCNLIQLL